MWEEGATFLTSLAFLSVGVPHRRGFGITINDPASFASLPEAKDAVKEADWERKVVQGGSGVVNKACKFEDCNQLQYTSKMMAVRCVQWLRILSKTVNQVDFSDFHPFILVPATAILLAAIIIPKLSLPMTAVWHH